MIPVTTYYAELRQRISESIMKAAHLAGYSTEGMDVEGTIDFSRSFGDISSSVAFRIAKGAGVGAAEVAAKITSGMEKVAEAEKITPEGGFINIHLDRGAFAENVMEWAAGWKGDAGKKGKIIVEYPSVNPNKPWHIGHLRNALLGDSIANICAFNGGEVEREDYIDDLGLQMVESLWGWLNLSSSPDKKFDHWLGEEYVKVNKRIEEHPINKELSSLLIRMERKDTEESKLSREISERCIKAQHQTAFGYGIYHDVMVWESDLIREKIFEKGMEILAEKGVAKKEAEGEYAGCLIIDIGAVKDLPKELAKLKEGVKVLVRSDGTPTYVGKDIAFHMWKLGLLEDRFNYREFAKQPNGIAVYTTSEKGERMGFGNASEAINIVDARQDYPQAVLRLALSLIGGKELSERVHHLSYGEVELEGAALSGRKGTWKGFTADDLMDEAVKKAESMMSDRNNIDEKERKTIARKIAASAIKFEFLKVSPEKRITFSWGNALNMEGNSGPYCQYMYVRAVRIIENSGGKGGDIASASSLVNDQEFRLVKAISAAGQIAQKAEKEMRPSIITEYLNNLSAAFAGFYEAAPILKEEDAKKREARIALVHAFMNVSGVMMALVGIEPVGAM